MSCYWLQHNPSKTQFICSGTLQQLHVYVRHGYPQLTLLLAVRDLGEWGHIYSHFELYSMG